MARPQAAFRFALSTGSASDPDEGHLGDRAAGIGWPAVAFRRLAPRPLRLDVRRNLRLRRDRTLGELETELFGAALVPDHDDPHVAASLELAEQHLVGERLLDRLLDLARHRAGAHVLIVAMLDEPLGRLLA